MEDIILKALCGSQLHGLATPESDEDWRTVYVEPTQSMFTMQGLVESRGASDNPQWEVAKFCRMAIAANPTVLEVLASPLCTYNQWGAELKGLLPAFISRKLVKDSFLGFATSQKHEAQKTEGIENTQKHSGARQAKYLSHYLRVLYAGERLLLTGRMILDVRGTEAEASCRATKFMEMAPQQALAHGQYMEQRLQEAYDKSKLPETPDIASINDFLIRLRKAHLA